MTEVHYFTRTDTRILLQDVLMLHPSSKWAIYDAFRLCLKLRLDVSDEIKEQLLREATNGIKDQIRVDFVSRPLAGFCNAASTCD